jgi:hypothetical protein
MHTKLLKIIYKIIYLFFKEKNWARKRMKFFQIRVLFNLRGVVGADVGVEQKKLSLVA